MPVVVLETLIRDTLGKESYSNRSGSISPVSIADRSKACTVYDSLNIEIAGSNLDWGMDVCLRVFVLCCPVFR
jgi:hypothetical protein